MCAGKLVFAQLTSYLLLTTVHRCVAAYAGEYKTKSFSCLEQFRCLAFAQKLHRKQRVRDFEPPGVGGQHRQHGRGGAAATGRSVAQCGGVNVG